jgi:LacI family transcriptional regulator
VPPGELIVRRSSDMLVFDDPAVVSALRFIKLHDGQAIGTKQVVDHVGLSRVTLDARFVESTGGTVAALIRARRIEQAKQLLSTSDFPMPTVARHAGFSCARQLSKTFHHVTGQTPTDYRRQFRIGLRPDA